MTKTFLVLFAVVCVAVLASGQTVSAPVQLSAQTIEKNAETLHLRGSVRIVVGDVIVTADEADTRTNGPGRPTEFDLRGNVHLTTNVDK